MIEFLGRQTEIQLLSTAINSSTQHFIVAIFGHGGIGKTRLMRELRERYRDASRVRMLDIIDFDVPAYDFTQVVGRALAREFPDAFGPYLESLYLRRQAEQGLIDTNKLPANALDLDHIFVACCNQAAREQRIVLLFDTVEKAYGRHSFAMLVEALIRVENLVIVLAGRPEDEAASLDFPTQIANLIEAGGRKSQLLPISLPPFDHAQSIAYVQRKQAQAGLDLDAEWQETLAILADGRPVLIDLAVELGKRFTAADWLRSLKSGYSHLAELKSSARPSERQEFDAILRRFGNELVGDLVHMRNKLVELTIVLACVAPLDRDSIAHILMVGPEQAAMIFAEASQRVLFKVIDDQLILLHDVALDLINRHVLPKIDAGGEREREYLRRAIEVLERQSQELLATIDGMLASDPAAAGVSMHGFDALYATLRAYQQARIRIAEYTFRLDAIQGVRQLEIELRALQRHGTMLGDLSPIFDAVRDYLPSLEQLSVDEYVNAHILLADQYIYGGQYEAARQVYDAIESQIQAAPLPRQYDVAHKRGGIEMGIGNVLQAMQYFQDAAGLAQTIGDSSKHANALLSYAWAARTYGSLYQPTMYYQQAFKLARTAVADPVEALRLQAIALNGMSYVYAIEKRSEARKLLRQAIEIRRSMGLRGRAALGQSYTTAGEVYCELGEPHAALTNLELAEEIFKDIDSSQGRQESVQRDRRSVLGNNQWFGKIYSARGRAYSSLWELAADPDEKRQHLEKAEAILRQAVDQAIAADKPRAYQRLGFVYAARPEQRRKAVETWVQGYQHAREFGDIFNEFNLVGNLAHMAVYGEYSPVFPNDQAFDDWFENYSDRVGRDAQMPFPVLRARFNVYRGCLALKRGDADAAFGWLNDGLSTLVMREHDLSYSFTWQIEFIKRDVLRECNQDQINSVARRLVDEWMEHNLGVSAWQEFESWAK